MDEIEEWLSIARETQMLLDIQQQLAMNKMVADFERDLYTERQENVECEVVDSKPLTEPTLLANPLRKEK